MQPAPPGSPPPAPPPGSSPPGYPPPGYPPPGYPPMGYGYPPPRKQSLLWLWITLGVVGGVMVLGILAAVAIPSFLSYQQKAKRGEAQVNLTVLGKAARSYYVERGTFPTTPVGRTPSEPCCMGPNRRCPVDPAAWASEPWQSLGFEPYDRHYFQYTYTPTADGQGFTVTAIGDLDCDGEEVVFTLTGQAINGDPRLSEIARPTNRD